MTMNTLLEAIVFHHDPIWEVPSTWDSRLTSQFRGTLPPKA